MCSENDSDTTYCSEVEELLKATTQTLRKTCANVPLRRSQRLYQKRKAKTMLSGNLADPAKSRKVTYDEDMKVSAEIPNKFTQDIFSTQDIREVEEIGQLNNISYNEIPSCATQQIPETIGVPLDLSKKSKELTVETLRMDLKATNAPIELEPCNIENVLRVSKSDNQERKKFSKKRRPRKSSSNKCSKAVSDLNKTSVTKNSEKGSIKPPDSVQDISNTKETSCDKKFPHKITYKKSFQSLKEKFPLISGKRIKVSDDETINNLIENENLAKMCNQKLSRRNNNGGQRKSLSKDCTKINLNISKKSNKISRRGRNKTFASVKNINHSRCNSCDKTDSYKETCKIKECSQILLNEHIESNKFKNEINTNNINILKSRSFIFNANNAEAGAVTNEFNNPDTKLVLETEIEDITKIQPIKRSCEKFSKTKTPSNEFQDVHKIIKSEPFSSMNMYEQTAEERNLNKILPGAVPNRLQNNSTQDKNQILKYRIPPITPKSSGELKTCMVLRSATTANISLKLPDDQNSSSKNKSNKLENNCQNLKREILSQKSERKVAETSQHSYFPKQMKKLSDQHFDEDALNKNELKNLKLNATGSRANFSKKRTVRRKTPNSIEYIKHHNEDIQSKVEVKTENPTLNKNYIKSFDRTKFLDKIQNSRNDFEILSSQNNNSKLNAYECLLTPADSSEDFLKRSILPNVYPPHFKHQLPPEAVLTRSLDCQPYSTSVITPDDTVSPNLLESSSSSPSLPESLCELFQAKDIKEILNVERKSYRLYNYHVQALALILKLRLEYLINILEKLINMSPHILKNIQKAVKMPFVPDNDIFATSPDNL